MATLPSECPECGKPLAPAYTSRGGLFRANIPLPAECSGAPECDWEDRSPYVCVKCGSYRRKDADPNPRTVGGRTLITVGRVCADCGEPSAV
jgi:hypothetical protein